MDKSHTVRDTNDNPDSHRRNYYEAEEQILQAINLLLKRPDSEYDITLSDVAYYAGLSRRAVYNHFDNTGSIFRENIEKMLDLTKAIAKASRSRDDDARKFLWNFMLMVSHNSIRFKVEHNLDRYRLWELVFPEIKDLLTQDWLRQPESIQNEIFRHYCAEFLVIMHMWGADGFSISSLEHYLHYLVRLTEKAPKLMFEIVRQ